MTSGDFPGAHKPSQPISLSMAIAASAPFLARAAPPAGNGGSGFVQALKTHDLQPSSDLVKYANPREDDGFNTTLKLLQLPDPPEAILTSNSLLAAGALRALRESKKATLEEVAFASFDETTWAKLVTPALTVIEQRTYEIGRTATELLIKSIQDPTRSTREVTLKGRLIGRRS
jgi:LacI family fructose operon transcriptional repressor